MTKPNTDAANKEVQATIDTLNKSIQAKDMEIKKLYKLTNILKSRQTDLEIQVADLSIMVETQQEIIQAQSEKIGSTSTEGETIQ